MNLNKNSDGGGEPEITIDTPAPISVEPPVATNFVATPVTTIASEVNTNATASSSSISNIQPTSTCCTVFAPATLEVGYTFPCRVDGIDFVAVVPDGGVTEGQAFQVPYPTNDPSSTPVVVSATERGTTICPLEVSSAPPPTINTSIPTGKWRNDIWDCFEVQHGGIFWQGLCCTPLLLGQVMTRSKLNALGLPTTNYDDNDSYPHSTFYIVAGLWVGFLFFLLIVGGIFDAFAFAIIWPVCIMAILAGNTRYILRQRYQIPVKCCTGCEGRTDDFCCGLWCACCVTIQMARHITHPQNEYQYKCCSSTGLYEGSPDIV